MEIRQAILKDAQRISYLIKKNIEHVKENNYTEEQIRIWKKANSPNAIKKSLQKRIIFCAFQNEKLIGIIGLQGNEVVGLYVSYSKRKLGIGKKLLQHIEYFAKTKNWKVLSLTSTPSAKRFYQSNGYQSIKPVVVTILNVEFRETEMRKIIDS